MGPREFLSHVFPHTGPYCIVVKKPNGEHWHFPAEDVDEAAAIAVEQDRNGENVFFAVGALIKARSWDAKQSRFRTVRSGDNIRGLRAYTCDMDAGAERAYPTVNDALNDLVRACRHFGLPKPTCVSSGNGLHVYWTLDREVPEADWEVHGQTLAAMIQSIGVKIDSGRTTDSSSILRVVGTHNYKYENKPEVQVLYEGTPIGTEHFHSLLVDTTNAVPASPPPRTISNAPPNPFGPANTNQYVYDVGDPKLLVKNCQAFRRAIHPDNQKQGRAAIPEPAWMSAMMLAIFCKDGRHVAHTISNQDPRYTEADCDSHFDRWKDDVGTGPTTCVKFKQAWTDFDGGNVCAGCPSEGKITSPIQVAKYIQIAAPIVVQEVQADGAVIERVIPEPPDDYVRTASGMGFKSANQKTGADETVVFCPYDMYPTKMQCDEDKPIERAVVWMVELPRSGWHETSIPNVSTNQLGVALEHVGIYLDPPDLPMMKLFMNNYVRKLQDQMAREVAYAKAGWRDQGFIMGGLNGQGVLYTPTGTVDSCLLTEGVDTSTTGGLHTKGTLDAWKQAAQLYNRPGLEAYRVFLYSSFGSVFYHMTDQIATCVNATGRGGIGKSTVLETCASVWGSPQSLILRDATLAASEAISNSLNHLPVMLDEITSKTAKDNAKFIFNYSGGRGRLRSQASGGIRPDTASWSNLCLSNANADIYANIAAVHRDSSPHLMRLVQLEFEDAGIVSKRDGDATRHAVHNNYGHAGHVFAKYIATRKEKIRTYITQYILDADAAVNATSAERFWTAWVACARAGAEIAEALGLLKGFPVAQDVQWMYDQIAILRTKTQEHMETAENILSDFIDSQVGRTLRLSAKNSGNIDNVADEPRGPLTVSINMDSGIGVISRTALQEYCIEKNINMSSRIEELFTQGIVLEVHAIKIIGANTKYAGGRARCVVVDMKKLNGGLSLVVNAPAAASPIASVGVP